VIFHGTKKDLERLDELHLAAWLAAVASLEYRGGLSRVRSGGRVHVWPGDPDDVAAALTSSGFRCKLWRVVDATVETYFVEVLGR
jgi:hypothetical protein